MGHVVGLRKVLASKRVLAAAAVSTGVLALGASPAAQAGRPAWTKAWSERLLRQSFDAVTAVCLPLGAAVRQAGTNAYREFVCTLVAGDGTRHTIHLRPRTRTAWTTLGSTQDKPTHGQGGPPGKPPPKHA